MCALLLVDFCLPSSFLSLHIIPPLHRHPHQTPRRDNHRPRKRRSPPRSLEVEPLAHEMRESNHIRPIRKLVDLRVVDVIRCI